MYRRAIAYNYQLYHKEFITMFITAAGVLMLLLSLIMAPTVGAINIGGPSDCKDHNAIVDCGVHSTGALKNAYNSSAYVRGVYAEFGISQADIASLDSTNVAGYVTKSGNVFVDGQSKAVATDAMTGGRQDMQPGSTKVNHQGAIFYKRPPSVSFQQDSLPAFVAMSNGRFQFAVIASCGNAVSAKPVSPPKQHTAVAPAKAVSHPKSRPRSPAPAPTQTQSQSQSQSQEVNINNTNINENSQAQINEQQQTAPQAAAVPAAQAQPAAETQTVQPEVQKAAATLPNTGPTGVIGAFLTAVGLGTMAYRHLLVRRFTR